MSHAVAPSPARGLARVAANSPGRHGTLCPVNEPRPSGHPAGGPTAAASFDDVLAANRRYATSYRDAALEATAVRGLAVLTCMDSRIHPLPMLGLEPGDAKILRNAGARVTEDVLRTLVLARYLLGVHRVMVVAHTGCRMTTAREEDVHQAISASGGPDTRSLAFLTTDDVRRGLTVDVQRLRSWPFLKDVQVGGFVYDLGTGLVESVC